MKENTPRILGCDKDKQGVMRVGGGYNIPQAKTRGGGGGCSSDNAWDMVGGKTFKPPKMVRSNQK